MTASLSVITINFNNKNGLERTLASVALQLDPTSTELVIVDGGSSDGSVTVASSFADGYPSIRAISEPDDGIYDAMNKALTLAEGDFVLFINSGDILIEGALSSALTALKGFDGNLALGKVRHLNGGNRESIVDPSGFSHRRMLLGSQQYNHQGIIFRRKALIEVGGFDTQFGFAADALAIVVLLEAGSPRIIDALLSEYEGGGVSAPLVAMMPLEFHRIRLRVSTPSKFGAYLSLWFARLQILRRRGILHGVGTIREWNQKVDRGIW